MYSILSWSFIAATVVTYVCGLVVYRLTLHPLARFPGPKWAAITRYYEAYFDLVQGGQYTFKIRDMHEQYGPVVRISPQELHVNDPTFFDTLYRQDAHYDKYAWAVDAMAAGGASIFTPSHQLHKLRRQPLNPFFSKVKVANSQDLMRRHLDKYCNRLVQLAKSGATFDFGASITAFARDVANDFILDKSYNSLDREDFDVAMLNSSHAGGTVWRFSKFVRWLGPTMQKIPISWIMKVADENTKQFFSYIQQGEQDTKRLMKVAALPAADRKSARTIVHEIMDSELPPSEKALGRVFEEVNLVTGAGFETTASALRLILFNVYSDLKIINRLRAELTAGGAAVERSLDLRALEQLPYLTAVLKEGLRLSPGIATRMARVSRTTDLSCGQWRIPAGTPVGMTLVLMHTDKEIFPEPNRYNPDRWLEGGVIKKSEHAFAPFSKGPRNCLGMHLAWAEMYMTVAEFALRFDVDFKNNTAEDFLVASDDFAIGTKGMGHVDATVAVRQS